MLAMVGLRLALGELLAADPDTLAPPIGFNEIKLVKEVFSLNENLDYADLVLASFTGSTAKATTPGAQQAGIDPITGDQIITILAPAGGWRWECTAAPTPAQTIYGFALWIPGSPNNLIAAQLLDTPITISQVGDFVDLGAITLRLVRQPLS